MGLQNAVDAPFNAGYLMLSRRLGKHRATVQWERFAVSDRDSTPRDTNRESGNGLCVAWRYMPDRHWQLGLQAGRLQSKRPQRRYFGADESASESQLLAIVRYTW